MSKTHRIQDSVHGLMEFKGMETLVVDVLRTPELQRLRRIRQLGLAHLVFPGAEHSRLVHSLGAAHLALRFGKQIRDDAQELFVAELCPDEASLRDLAIAALCHDLGHAPLAHAWEREIVGHDFSREKWASALGLSLPAAAMESLKWHELVGLGFLGWQGGDLHKLLEGHERGSALRAQQMLMGQHYISYLPRLLSSDVDVDRADFLRRDTHQTGVAYGRYDLDWLISTAMLGRHALGKGKSEWVIGFDDRKAPRVVEQFLIARRALYETVYYHKTVRCAEAMMALFVKRLKGVARDGKLSNVNQLVKPLVKVVQGEVVGPNELLGLDDFALWVLMENIAAGGSKDYTVRDLARRLVTRDLFKMVPVSSEELGNFISHSGGFDAVKDVLRSYTSGDPNYYYIYDSVSFRMLQEEEPQKAYFVRKNREAYHIPQHTAIRGYAVTENWGGRLFTLREACDAVTKLIRKS